MLNGGYTLSVENNIVPELSVTNAGQSGQSIPGWNSE